MRLVHSQPLAASICPALAPITVRMRMRPGERPYWADASPWHDRWESWRESARSASIPVEAAVSCLLEYQLSCVELQRWVEQPEALLDRAAESDLSQTRLAGDEEFRRWLDVLDHDASINDGLPEIALPQRLMRTPAVLEDWGSRVDPGGLDRALHCERAAALQGHTLEGWALRAGLTSVSCAATG